MDFPLRVLKFRLVDYVEEKESTTYVRYLLKKKGAFVFTFIEKKGNGFMHTVQSIGMEKKDGFGRYYSSQEQACDAMLLWMIRFKIND